MSVPGIFRHGGDGFFHQPAKAMRADNVVPWAAKRSNSEVFAGSAFSTDLTSPRATMGAWLDNQHCSLLTR